MACPIGFQQILGEFKFLLAELRPPTVSDELGQWRVVLLAEQDIRIDEGPIKSSGDEFSYENIDAEEGSTAEATESEELSDAVLRSMPSTGIPICNRNILHNLTDPVIEI